MLHDHANDHNGEHGHNSVGHAHAPANFGRAFVIGIALNAAYVLAEAFYGIASHSLALLADAGHMLGDGAALLVALVAQRVAMQPRSAQRTYGARRAEVLAAFTNGIALALAGTLLSRTPAAAQNFTVAAASDLQSVLPAIAAQFEKDTGQKVMLTFDDEPTPRLIEPKAS